MPLNVGRSYTSIFFVIIAFAISVNAQSPQTTQSPAPAADQAVVKTPTAAEVMRARISKAKALIAVRNYGAAIYELESIRRETSDPSVQPVINVLLMNSYIEQGDHKRAQALLVQFYNELKTTKPGALENYSIVAGQVIKGARSQAERYRNFGLSVSDRNLPLEALNDLERMRETVELVITQAKEMSADKARSATAIALIEEATNSRAMIARDDYDAKRWRDAVADSREQMANSRSVIINAVDSSPQTTQPPAETVAVNNPVNRPPAPPLVTKTADSRPLNQPPVEPLTKPAESQAEANDKTTVLPEKKAIEKPAAQPDRTRIVAGSSAAGEEKKRPEPQPAPAKPSGPVEIGSMIAYATKQAPAVYPSTAKSMRATGIVKVEFTVDEEGNVEEIQNASGPSLLQSSAKDAIKKWKFRPFVIDGQAVKATGYVNFNFSL